MPIRLGYLDFANTLAVANVMAPFVESLGFTRYWFAEHPPQASPIGLAAMTGGLTQTMRVGTAGVLVNLHNPYQVAQEFRLWGATFADRFDAGVCPGMASRPEVTAIFRGPDNPISRPDYEARVETVFGLMRENLPKSHVLHGIEQSGLANPAQPWVLGSGPGSVDVAVKNSAHYGYSIFHKQTTNDPGCIRRYRETYRAVESGPDAGPHAVLALSVACSETPIDTSSLLTAQHAFFVNNVVGPPAHCREVLRDLVARYQVDELILLDLFLSDELRMNSMRFCSEIAKAL